MCNWIPCTLHANLSADAASGHYPARQDDETRVFRLNTHQTTIKDDAEDIGDKTQGGNERGKTAEKGHVDGTGDQNVAGAGVVQCAGAEDWSDDPRARHIRGGWLEQEDDKEATFSSEIDTLRLQLVRAEVELAALKEGVQALKDSSDNQAGSAAKVGDEERGVEDMEIVVGEGRMSPE